MKQDRVRKDFYLSEDYDAYRAQFALEAFVREKLALNPKNTAKLLELADEIQHTSYSAGYANAEFDAAENS
jgi:hypothetical protein